MINSTYAIVPTVEITDAMVEESINEPDTLRYNNDKSKAVLKFCTSFPSSVQGYSKYNHEEITAILKLPEWKTTM